MKNTVTNNTINKTELTQITKETIMRTEMILIMIMIIMAKIDDDDE